MRKKVLIVDDDPLNRRLFHVVLSSEGYDTVATAEGGAAVEIARAEMPDLILMDMCMPDLDGLKATEIIKKDAQLMGVPVIAVTALAGAEHAARAKDGGCEDCIHKPVSIHGFLESVGRYLN